MNLEGLKEELNKFLKKENLKLYEVNYFKKDNILQVMLDETMDLDALEKVSEKISLFMDGIDEDMDKYLLDVTTVGAERPIKNEEEVIQAVGKYVFVKTKESTINGDLEKYEEGKLYLSYKDKTKISKAVIDYKDVKQMRYAIKF